MGKTTISPKKEEPSRWKKREESTEVPFHEKNHEFCKVKLMQFKRTSENCSSEEEHKVNALASGAEEGRD